MKYTNIYLKTGLSVDATYLCIRLARREVSFVSFRKHELKDLLILFFVDNDNGNGHSTHTKTYRGLVVLASI